MGNLFFLNFLLSSLLPSFLGMSAISKEVTGPNAMAKHSLLSDQQMESPPKRPKSSEGKTSANEQVSVRPLRCDSLSYLPSCHLPKGKYLRWLSVKERSANDVQALMDALVERRTKRRRNAKLSTKQLLAPALHQRVKPTPASNPSPARLTD